ncbi:MAG: DnaJ domain-containing protein [Deltaproteobacteria bacterium]|nr:DnaJ domain-containing protein [Deltaproteobacteria bacterium]
MTTPQLIPAYKGDLAVVSPARVLYRLAVARETGILQFAAGEDAVSFIMSNGEIEDIFSRSTDYNLVGHMLRTGRLSQQQVEDVHKVMNDFGGRVIDTLVSLAILKSFEVIEVYNEFVKVVTAGVLQLRAGAYVFYKFGGETPPSQSPVKFPTLRLVVEAARAVADHSFFADLFYAPARTRFAALANPRLTIADLKPAARDLRAYRLCEQGGMLSDLLAALKIKDAADEPSVFAFLYVLREFELLSVDAPERSRQIPELAGNGFDLTDDDLETAPPVADPAEIAQLSAERDRLKDLDPFGRLGLTPSAADADVKKAYLKVAKAFHPDTIPLSAPAEIRALKEEIFELVADAYKALETAVLRKAAAGGPAGGVTEDQQVDIRPILEAEQKFMRAKTLLKGGRGIEEALNLLTDAVNANDGEVEYRIYYNWALWLARGAKDPTIKTHVIAEFQAALSERPHENGWLFLAQVYKTSGEIKKCEEAFKKVLEIAPGNHIAALELRLLQKRKK